MEKPLVSVLMPVYNAEKYLAEAIESILTQSLSDFEFIIIDDFSTDSSADIIRSYNDRRIRYFRNDINGGITTSLNRGIDISTTDLIARMDADDISYPERLYRQYRYLQENADCVLVSSQANVVTADRKLIYTDTTPSEYYYFKLTFTSPFFHSSVMYRTLAVQSVGKYTVPYAEDFELFWQLARKYKIYNLPEMLLDYRVTDNSLFHSSKKAEYAEAVNKQCLRNIQFYTGTNFAPPESHLKCFQFEYDMLLKENRIKSILNCISELDYITSCIIKTENVNRSVAAIRGASVEKKNDIIEYFLKKLPYPGKIVFLITLGRFKRLKEVIVNSIAVRLRKAK